MILPKIAQTTAAVAVHYDELDPFYREIWGEHVHHGFWETGQESPAQATEALIRHLAARLDFLPGQAVCDIGCGYGATASYFAAHYGVEVTGFTVSAAQAGRARALRPAAGRVTILCEDWLANTQPAQTFARAYAVESSEHMPEKQVFFDQAFRVLAPGGRLAICAWLAADAPRGWEVRHLLEPICREGRLPGMGTEAEYDDFARAAGFIVRPSEDLSSRVSRTWWICFARLLKGLVSRPDYRKFLLDARARNRVFALTLPRLMLAYATGAMRYGLLVYDKPIDVDQ